MNNVTHDATCGACYCPFLIFKLYPFLFGEFVFNTYNGEAQWEKEQWFFGCYYFFFSSTCVAVVFFFFSWSNLNWSVSRSTCMRHKVNNHRLFILSCFIPNSFSFFWFLWFSLCLIVARSLFFASILIGRFLCRTFGGVCFAFDVFYVHTGWLVACLRKSHTNAYV